MDADSLEYLVKNHNFGGKKLVLYFMADWCKACKNFKKSYVDLEELNIEIHSGIAYEAGVNVLPSFVIINSKGEIEEKIEGGSGLENSLAKC